MPLPITLFALACLLSLFLISGGTLWLAVALCVLILASYVLRLRLPAIWLPSLLFGGILLALAILTTPQDNPHAANTIIPQRTAFIFGEAAAILMVIQFYRPTPSDPAHPRLFALLGGILVLVASCNTIEEGLLRQLIPALVLLLALSLRTLRVRKIAQKLTLVSLSLALVSSWGTGWLGAKVIRDNRETLTEWGNRFMNERPQPELLGMAQQPVLGSVFGARGSNARVLRLAGELRSAHLRGAAFDAYMDSRWSPALNNRSFDTLDPHQLDLPVPRTTTVNRVMVTRLQSANSLVLSPLETLSLELGEGEHMEWARDSSGPIRVRAPQPYTYFYHEGATDTQRVLALPALRDKASRERYLQVPDEIREGLRPLAMKITLHAATPAEKVASITDYLLENYPYSLTFNPSMRPRLLYRPGRHPDEPATDLMQAKRYDMILRFLLSEPKQGAHCEYFATGAALLLRCVGVPTRYVTGYFAHEDEGPQTILVRQRDAHAWCEAWVDGTGWVTVEATPPTGWPEQNKSPLEPWRRAWEWVEDRWLGLMGWLADREPTQLALFLLLPFAAIGLGALWQHRRRMPAPLAVNLLLPPANLAALAHRFEAALSPDQALLSPTQPWSELLPQLPEALQPSANAFIQLYQRARFGGQAVEKNALEQALRAVEDAVKQHTSATHR